MIVVQTRIGIKTTYFGSASLTPQQKSGSQDKKSSAMPELMWKNGWASAHNPQQLDPCALSPRSAPEHRPKWSDTLKEKTNKFKLHKFLTGWAKFYACNAHFYHFWSQVKSLASRLWHWQPSEAIFQLDSNLHQKMWMLAKFFPSQRCSTSGEEHYPSDVINRYLIESSLSSADGHEGHGEGFSPSSPARPFPPCTGAACSSLPMRSTRVWLRVFSPSLTHWQTNHSTLTSLPNTGLF